MLSRGAMLSLVLFTTVAAHAGAADLPKVRNVELQPLAAQVQRLLDALDFLGAPLPEKDTKTLREVGDVKDKSAAINTIQTVLDAHCLAGVRITSREKIETFSGPARPELAEQGWRIFLVKVHNQGEVSGMELRGKPGGLARVNSVEQQAGSKGRFGRRAEQAIHGVEYVCQPAAYSRSIGPGARVSHPSNLLSRRRPQRSQSGIQPLAADNHEAALATHRREQRGRVPVRQCSCSCRAPGSDGQRRQAYDCGFHDQRFSGTRVPFYEPAARARFSVSTADLSGGRRDGDLAARQIPGRLYARARVPYAPP